MSESEWSVPESAVYARARDLLASDEPAVLATVVAVEGNAYRRPGAKMLLTPDGDGLGSVTAGCLEDELRRLAADVLDAGEPRVETYDMLDDDDDVWGLGVGCNGVIDVLLEPLTDAHRPALDALAENESLAMVTVLDGDCPPGTRAYYRPGDGATDGEFTEDGDAPGWLRDAAADHVRSRLDRERSEVITVETDEGTATLFVDALVPPPRLVVVGSGHDVGPVVELAANVDFRVEVVSYRGTVTAEQFPAAESVETTSPAQLRDVASFDENTHVVVMTHNFVDDRLTLEAVLETPVPYVGLMGPRERFEELVDAMADDETAETPSEADRERIFTPIGLNLGGGSPYQIAHSIVAELLAVANDRDPSHLAEREGPIHDRVAEN